MQDFKCYFFVMRCHFILDCFSEADKTRGKTQVRFYLCANE